MAAKKPTAAEKKDKAALAEKKRWDKEMAAADRAVKDWHLNAEDAIKAYVDDRESDNSYGRNKVDTRLNYYTASIQQQQALLFGNTPHTNVDRRFADGNDEIARIGGEMLERVLNEDLEDGSDGQLRAMHHSLEDFLQADMGCVWVRYEVEEAEAETPEGKEPDPEAAPQLGSERVHVDWLYWRDIRWSAGTRVWEERRWTARKVEMDKPGATKRFGKDVATAMQFGKTKKTDQFDAQNVDPRERAEVWEIWDRENKKAIWWTKDYPTLLDSKDDPLGLEDFDPCPRPMVRNSSTSAFMPVPDHKLCRDQYKKLNNLATRMTLLEQAIAVRGVYNGASEGVKKLLDPTSSAQNALIPVDNWALHGEKGGLKGQVDWLPLDMIVNALGVLREEATETRNLLQELNGQNDIVRGEQLDANTTATDSRRAAHYASARMQSKADEFARFASDIRRIKAEIISKHFEPETIIQLSNVLQTDDAAMAEQGAEFIKSDISKLRIEIRPESLSQTDFSAEKSEAVELIGALGTFIQSVGPIVQQMPAMGPVALKLLKQSMAKMRGARWAGAILDPAIDQAEKQMQMQQQNPQAQPPDPKLAVVQAKAQADAQKNQQTMQMAAQKAQLDVASQAQIQQTQTAQNLEEEKGRLQLKHQAKVADAVAFPKPPPMNGVVT